MSAGAGNTVAAEVWSQIFARLSQEPNAAIVRPEYDPAEDDERARKALSAAGWSDEQIALRCARDVLNLALAPITSPGINPYAEFIFGRLCDDVERAMKSLGYVSQERVSRGIEPRLGPYAAQTNVPMTGEAIVSVGAHFFRFCGLIARATTRTLLLAPSFWESPSYAETAARHLIAGSPEIARYWVDIYLSYALAGTHFNVEYKPATQSEVVLFEQMARAMELFALSHEYGHHHLDHGRGAGSSSLQSAVDEEYAADQFALRVCYEIEKMPTILGNPYLSSGAGGVILLISLRTLRSVELMLGKEPKIELTHPETGSRIQRFESVAVLRPKEFCALKAFRIASERILKLVDQFVIEVLKNVPSEELRSYPRVEFGVV